MTGRKDGGGPLTTWFCPVCFAELLADAKHRPASGSVQRELAQKGSAVARRAATAVLPDTAKVRSQDETGEG